MTEDVVELHDHDSNLESFEPEMGIDKEPSKKAIQLREYSTQ
jgi:hypothetical protein